MKLTKRDVDGVYRLDFGSGTAPIFLSEEEMDELRAHLQAERDEALGRWRDPENPDIVVYALSMIPGIAPCTASTACWWSMVVILQSPFARPTSP